MSSCSACGRRDPAATDVPTCAAALGHGGLQLHAALPAVLPGTADGHPRAQRQRAHAAARRHRAGAGAGGPAALHAAAGPHRENAAAKKTQASGGAEFSTAAMGRCVRAGGQQH